MSTAQCTLRTWWHAGGAQSARGRRGRRVRCRAARGAGGSRVRGIRERQRGKRGTGGGAAARRRRGRWQAGRLRGRATHLDAQNAAGGRWPRSADAASGGRSGSACGDAVSDGEETLETKSTDARHSATSAHAQPIPPHRPAPARGARRLAANSDAICCGECKLASHEQDSSVRGS